MANKEFKFHPLQKVYIVPLDCVGRVEQCILSAKPINEYLVYYIMNGDLKRADFYEDDLELIKE